jgi:multiple sugar transport system ATP-binding protein
MGMETLVYFSVSGREVCGRVSPTAPAAPGQPMQLAADLDHMHLIDPQTDQVI